MASEPAKAKVLHISSQLDFGGVEEHSSIIAEYSSSSSFHHEFAAISRGGPAAEKITKAGAATYILRQSVSIPSFKTLHRLIILLREVRPTVVHTRGASANFHGVLAAAYMRVPVVIAEEIGFPSHSTKARIVFRTIYRATDKVIAISDAVAQQLVELGEIRQNKVCVVYNPVRPVPPIGPSKEEKSKFTIGFVGRLEPVKNPLSLVQAVENLKRKEINVFLKIVGDGSQRLLLEENISKLGIADQVSLIGFKSNPFNELADCDLYVQPSLSEGFGLALAEAMSAGIPVLATSTGGAKEFVKEGETGWLLGALDACNIARKIEKVICMNPDLRGIVAASGQAEVARFRPEYYINTVDRIYDEILTQKGFR